MVSVSARADGDSSGVVSDFTGQIQGIYCYDYYFLGNKGFDTRLFSGTKTNATFFDEEDLSYYKGQEQCGTYVVTDSAVINLFAPFSDEKKDINYSSDSTKLLPDPRIGFVKEGSLEFEQFKSRDTLLYGGVLPFVALPDSNLETEDSVFNQDSFSLFFYFKTKF